MFKYISICRIIIDILDILLISKPILGNLPRNRKKQAQSRAPEALCMLLKINLIEYL